MAYHIRKDGTPGVCNAQPGNCPLGGAGEHFDTVEQAQEYAEIKNASKFGLINNVKAKYDVGNDNSIADEVKYLSHEELQVLNDDIKDRNKSLAKAIERHRNEKPFDKADYAEIKDVRNKYYADEENLFNASYNCNIEHVNLLNLNDEITNKMAEENNADINQAVQAVLEEPTLNGRLAQKAAPGSWGVYTNMRTRIENEFKYSQAKNSYTQSFVASERAKDMVDRSKGKYLKALNETIGTDYIEQYGDPATLRKNGEAVKNEIEVRKQLNEKGMSNEYAEYEASNIPENEIAITSYGRIVNAYTIDKKNRVDKIVGIEDTPIGKMFVTEKGFSVQDDTENLSRIFIDKSVPGNMGSVSAKDNGEFK